MPVKSFAEALEEAEAAWATARSEGLQVPAVYDALRREAQKDKYIPEILGKRPGKGGLPAEKVREMLMAERSVEGAVARLLKETPSSSLTPAQKRHTEQLSYDYDPLPAPSELPRSEEQKALITPSVVSHDLITVTYGEKETVSIKSKKKQLPAVEVASKGKAAELKEALKGIFGKMKVGEALKEVYVMFGEWVGQGQTSSGNFFQAALKAREGAMRALLRQDKSKLFKRIKEK